MAFAAPLMAALPALSAGGATAAAAGIGALGSIYSGFAQKAQADAMADNAAANAANLRRQSNANEESQRRENKLRMGAVRASAAESGFDPNSGSLASLQVKNAQELELDVLTQRYSDELSSLSLQNEASNLRAQGKAARNSGFMSAAGTVFQGAVGYGQASRNIPFYGVGGAPY
jgi:pyruvate/2-oxoglutarate dehydrogenase complex dihydrolipoamide acyltransferase (E2) component